MCGIIGVAASVGSELSVSRADVESMRDRLAHRGPDDAALWWGDHVCLAHRRLGVVGLGPEGDQPLISPDGRHVLVYNGELYNDDLVRCALEREGAGVLGSASDTPTVLRALEWWGTDAFARFRGMYALAWYDRLRRVLTLARDPMGIKPLVWWRGATPRGVQIAFASEATGLLAHPHIRARPDWATVSAYLTTIRTTLGSRTMFDGVRSVSPGEWIQFDLSRRPIAERRGQIVPPSDPARWAAAASDPIGATSAVVGESVRRHLRSDVPLCALLSGGIDSAIICAEARRHVDRLHTYCAGARAEPGVLVAGAADSPDFAFAAQAAQALGTSHTEVPVTREGFIERWRWMVDRLGLPLTTPNQVAIHAVASELRAGGHVVALTGEGADELLGGYDRPLGVLSSWITRRLEGGAEPEDLGADAGVVAIDSAAWVPRDAKQGLLRPAMWEGVEHDAALVETYRDDMAWCVEQAGAIGSGCDWSAHDVVLQGVLNHQRRVNLVGLLERLDASTMLAGVEGRTPFADIEVAGHAERLPMVFKFVPALPGRGTTPASPPRTRTKLVLRRAWAGRVPEAVLQRDKASFPLPFQAWMGDAADVLDGSALLEWLCEPGAIDLVRGDPVRHWNLAWPMLNLAMWGRRWGW